MTNQTLQVKGMSCGHCVKSIEGNVGELQGVESVKVNLSSGKVDVVFQSSEVKLEQIIATIEDSGYEVQQ
ncbi:MULTISPECIES: copper chaperone CopZ [Jeotgalibacillus]|uniref:copper chaperone CopZ n=1 Tax=Jeotgalibacillus TaxID=157226 RepID=UPI001069AAE4|nr:MULTISPECIES: copper chaperone CopZ [Jeotgalibacillus]TFD94560.1 copper chaperone CopZ [Jeotgalibacillus sp. R-1-5s-1]